MKIILLICLIIFSLIACGNCEDAVSVPTSEITDAKFWGECEMCLLYLKAGYVAGCDFGGGVSDICGPYTDACDMAFKLVCSLCDAEHCSSSCLQRYSCGKMHMCGAS